MNWIDVKDKLPKSNCDVIVYTSIDEVEIGNCIGSKWLTSSYGKVLYWMPLPNKPDCKQKTKQKTCPDENVIMEREEITFSDLGWIH
jgi:hypothetical protein